MTTCTELPIIRRYGSTERAIPVQTLASSEGLWLSDQTDMAMPVAKDAFPSITTRAYAELPQWPRRAAGARPKYTSLDEADLEVDSSRAWEARIIRFQAQGFVRKNDPRRR
jgi:hypothetical protein